jgi:hypothetical protein
VEARAALDRVDGAAGGRQAELRVAEAAAADEPPGLLPTEWMLLLAADVAAEGAGFAARLLAKLPDAALAALLNAAPPPKGLETGAGAGAHADAGAEVDADMETKPEAEVIVEPQMKIVQDWPKLRDLTQQFD